MVEQQAPWLQVVKMLVAIAVSWVASSLLLGTELPIFAAIAALLVAAAGTARRAAKQAAARHRCAS